MSDVDDRHAASRAGCRAPLRLALRPALSLCSSTLKSSKAAKLLIFPCLVDMRVTNINNPLKLLGIFPCDPADRGRILWAVTQKQVSR